MDKGMLNLIASIHLTPTMPFEFDSTFHKPDHFTSGDNSWEQKFARSCFFDQAPANPVPVGTRLAYFERYGRFKPLAVHYSWEDLWWKRKKRACALVRILDTSVMYA